jgi:cobalamin biosynthesis protein CbiG
MAKRRMIAVIYLTAAGKSVAERLAAGWDQESLEVIAAGSSLSSQVRSLWDEYESFIFIMAVGIVVRLIAPLLKSKWDDPGVVVVDEGGHFAVSLVGGHWGGSNALARQVAALLGAVSVITTATDVQGKPALDTLAKQWGMLPLPRERVKEANKAFLAGERVVIYTEWDLQLADEKGIEVLPLACLNWSAPKLKKNETHALKSSDTPRLECSVHRSTQRPYRQSRPAATAPVHAHAHLQQPCHAS